jgi:L-cysteine S-thiosulfotransferase
MRITLAVACLAGVLAAGSALSAERAVPVKPGALDRLLTGGFKQAPPEWQARLVQDETQKVCSATRNAPAPQAAAAIRRREKASIVYPTDGVFMGDWKKGEALAQSGYGLRFTDYPPRQETGGNCYACHQLDAVEVSYGTLGPSLAGYGKVRKFGAPFEKAVYEHIFNPHASQACAGMPRFGTMKILTIDQIKDLVAYVMSPESPVNK